ncbi:MAG: fatty acid desaturase [Alphaproteobacteria bacterium]|nr:fatty acid desaturase [Alphaproteobacteria bacterium]
MNPLAEAIKNAQFAPMSEVSKTLQIRWYRCPVDKKILRDLMQPSDARGLVQALGHLGLWLVTGGLCFAFFLQQAWIAFAVALFVHGTVAAFFTAPHHELCHGTVFKSKRLNWVFLRLYSLLGWNNFEIYQFSHNFHHRFTLHPEGDREEVMPATPSLAALYILQLFTVNIFGGYQSKGIVPTLQNFIQIALGRFDNPFNSWGTELYEGYDEHRKKAAAWARITLLVHGGIILAAFAAGYPILAVLISGSTFIANWWRYFVGVPMHCGLKSNETDFRKSVRTITLDPLSEFLYWNMNWHLEHHMYAGVPCYNLKALYQATAEDMPAPRTLLGAWQEMRMVWKRQQAEPDYAYDTPVPEAKDPSVKTDAGLAKSVGYLGPKELAP